MRRCRVKPWTHSGFSGTVDKSLDRRGRTRCPDEHTSDSETNPTRGAHEWQEVKNIRRARSSKGGPRMGGGYNGRLPVQSSGSNTHRGHTTSPPAVRQAGEPANKAAVEKVEATGRRGATPLAERRRANDELLKSVRRERHQITTDYRKRGGDIKAGIKPRKPREGDSTIEERVRELNAAESRALAFEADSAKWIKLHEERRERQADNPAVWKQLKSKAKRDAKSRYLAKRAAKRAAKPKWYGPSNRDAHITTGPKPVPARVKGSQRPYGNSRRTSACDSGSSTPTHDVNERVHRENGGLGLRQVTHDSAKAIGFFDVCGNVRSQWRQLARDTLPSDRPMPSYVGRYLEQLEELLKSGETSRYTLDPVMQGVWADWQNHRCNTRGCFHSIASYELLELVRRIAFVNERGYCRNEAAVDFDEPNCNDQACMDQQRECFGKATRRCPWCERTMDTYDAIHDGFLTPAGCQRMCGYCGISTRGKYSRGLYKKNCRRCGLRMDSVVPVEAPPIPESTPTQGSGSARAEPDRCSSPDLRPGNKPNISYAAITAKQGTQSSDGVPPNKGPGVRRAAGDHHLRNAECDGAQRTGDGDDGQDRCVSEGHQLNPRVHDEGSVELHPAPREVTSHMGEDNGGLLTPARCGNQARLPNHNATRRNSRDSLQSEACGPASHNTGSRIPVPVGRPRELCPQPKALSRGARVAQNTAAISESLSCHRVFLADSGVEIGHGFSDKSGRTYIPLPTKEAKALQTGASVAISVSLVRQGLVHIGVREVRKVADMVERWGSSVYSSKKCEIQHDLRELHASGGTSAVQPGGSIRPANHSQGAKHGRESGNSQTEVGTARQSGRDKLRPEQMGQPLPQGSPPSDEGRKPEGTLQGSRVGGVPQSPVRQQGIHERGDHVQGGRRRDERGYDYGCWQLRRCGDDTPRSQRSRKTSAGVERRGSHTNVPEVALHNWKDEATEVDAREAARGEDTIPPLRRRRRSCSSGGKGRCTRSGSPTRSVVEDGRACPESGGTGGGVPQPAVLPDETHNEERRDMDDVTEPEQSPGDGIVCDRPERDLPEEDGTVLGDSLGGESDTPRGGACAGPTVCETPEPDEDETGDGGKVPGAEKLGRYAARHIAAVQARREQRDRAGAEIAIRRAVGDGPNYTALSRAAVARSYPEWRSGFIHYNNDLD